MASVHATTSSILSSFLPRLAPATATFATRSTTLYSRQLSHPLLPVLTIPSAIHLNIPGFLEGLWEGILKAVPKKKTSHMKKRHRQMAGKGLQDVTNLNRCSACGHIKRAHLLCPYCVAEIKTLFKTNAHEERFAEKQARADEIAEQKIRIEAGKVRAAEEQAKKEAELVKLETKRAEKKAAKDAARKIYEEKNPKQVIGQRKID
ncbi:7ae55fb3-9afa-41ec-9ca5-4c5e4aaf801a [Sclerotinia trifoliorum]|uniref:Large ribosomal subunit protein bL32m n=1 Tax=Sclerotinia trifoliorum TaxID=28548 RepID=A0A8H2ZQX4_9HELO|nr:7ae55fb3-9afa-41ec-9ca5-4c5e4aaf801a [Sclerotinia trifoliorum]